jgi:phosphoribosylformylglycinamidine cyclo-ligase
MYRTFNCGVGMVLVVDNKHQQACLKKLNELGEKAWVIGEIIDKKQSESVIFS